VIITGKKLGRYKILKLIGSGGFGTVYLAFDTWLAQEVAIKVPHRQEEELSKLIKEARLQAFLRHPNIASLLTVEKKEGIFFLVMEYVDGTNLSTLIKKKRRLDIKTTLNFLTQILEAVAYAHSKNVIHRDLRSSNILISREGVVKITDFGTSKFMEKTFASTRIGSPPYMAPEQFEGRATFASDIYSIGCIAYEMLTGRVPIMETDPRTIYAMAKEGKIDPPRKYVSTIPIEVEEMVMKALMKNPSDRYSSAKEFLEVVKSFSGGGTITHTGTRGSTIKNKGKTKCWNCGRIIPEDAKICPYCGEIQ